MASTNENVSKGLDILKQVIKWGLGGIIAIVGLIILVAHKQLGYEFPWQIAAGVPLVCIGAIVYLIVYITDKRYKQKVSTCTKPDTK